MRRTVATGAAGEVCNVLVVADDWDYASPNEGGLPYYSSALDVLGLDYDVWDTESPFGDSPQFADMAPYDAVIWFTGYAWGYGVFTNFDEFYAGLYLDAGGNLILSSHDYYYEADTITPFMEDYLGIDLILDDVVITTITGMEGDPIGGGLGPYTLVRPDDWDVYWPAQPPEGPLDDAVFASDLPGSAEPFRYDSPANTEPNSTRYDGGDFRTVYLGWPFEWVDTVDERAEILGSMLHWMGCDPLIALTPSQQAKSGSPGSSVPYTLTLANNLGAMETFEITYGSDWSIAGPELVGPIPDGGDVSFVVTVTIPIEAVCYLRDQAVVTATALSDPLTVESAQLDTLAEPAGVGGVQGIVYDSNTLAGVPEALLRLSLAGNNHEAYTNGSGHYAIAEIPACVYEGQASAMGYSQADLSVAISDGLTTTLDLFLDAPMPVLSHNLVSVSVPYGGSATAVVTLVNSGSADLNVAISERSSMNLRRGKVLDQGLSQERLSVGRDWGLSAAASYAAHAVDPQVYADMADSGTAKFIVYMAEQADLSAAFGIKDRSERGHYVLDALRSTAERSQAGLVAELTNAGIAHESRYIVNAVVVAGDLDLVESIASRPDVAYVGANRATQPPTLSEVQQGDQLIQATVSWGITRTRAISAWEEFGALGQGIVVASIDTGVTFDHEVLVRRYRGRVGGGIYDHNFDWWDPYGLDPLEPYDGANHGTPVMGAILGNDNPNDPFLGDHILGMAPGAVWFTCQGFSNRGTGPAYDADLLACAEFVLAPWDLNHENANPDLRADVVNNPWGNGQAQWWYGQALYAWQAAGIFSLFAAGDQGPSCETAASPGDLQNAIGVGASDVQDNVVVASSRGPAKLTGLVKPNVIAPGKGIYAASGDGSYGYRDGTSLAAAHVAGQVAQLWSAVPGLRGDVALTTWIIEQSAVPIVTDQECGGVPGDQVPNNTFGWGRIDALEAVNLGVDGSWDIPWLAVEPTSAIIMAGDSLDIELIFNAQGLSWGEEYTGSLELEYNDPYVVRARLPLALTVRCTALTNMALSGPIEVMTGETHVYTATWQPISATAPIVIEWSNGGVGRTAAYSWAEPGSYTVWALGTNCGGTGTALGNLNVNVQQSQHSIYLPIVLRGH